MTNSLEIAEKFVRCFCSGDIEGIGSVLSENFRLRGPLFEFDTCTDYLASLSDNLAPDPNSEILSALSKDNEAAVFFTYHGNTIGQLFRCREGRIYETILVFDTSKVAEHMR